MTAQRILVVDDEVDIRTLLHHQLAREGFGVVCAENGEAGLELALREDLDGILLDILLPGLDGFEVLKKLKAHPKTRSVPVVMLSARVEDADIVAALELGAEDYVTKPFSPRVLIARLKSVIRFRHASPIEDAQVIRLRGIRIHPGRREVLAGKTSVALTPSEFSLLHMLAQRPGWVFTRAQIINTLHGNDNIVNVRSVDYLVSGLKKKLGAQSGSIESVRGYGYRVAPEASMPGPN